MEDPVDINCPHCQEEYTMEAKMLGTMAVCGSCEKSFTIITWDSAIDHEIPINTDFCNQCYNYFQIKDLIRIEGEYCCANCKSTSVQRLQSGVKSAYKQQVPDVPGDQSKDGLAISSMILGILSLTVVCCCVYISAPQKKNPAFAASVVGGCFNNLIIPNRIVIWPNT